MAALTCPSREQLSDYAVGRLADDASEAIASHVDACADCQAELASFDGVEDTLVAQLGRPAAVDPVLQESQCLAAIDRAKAAWDRPETPQESSGRSLCGMILGEYRLLEELGHGGMGTVYKAVQTKLDRVVALKVLTRGRVGDPRATARFEREMRAVGKLDHRHIVRAHDAREIEGTLLLVMEFVEGLDLAEIVRRVGALPVAEACEAARQTAVGLQYVHEHGLVHRDVKPSNLMLTPQGEIKILDLGLARFHADPASASEAESIFPSEPAPAVEATGTDQPMGTLDYMAPEQIRNGREVDIRADVYSLGCTLYKLLTGRTPFGDPEYNRPAEKMAAHARRMPPPIRQINPAVPAALSAVVDRMLAKEPAERYADPDAAAAALSPFAAGADLQALLARAASDDARNRNSCSPSPTVIRTKPRRRIYQTVAVALLMLGGGGGLWGILIQIEKNGKTTNVTVPEGSDSTVAADGSSVKVKLPPDTGQEKTESELPSDTPPQIVETSPAIGAEDVDPALSEITVTFDRDMAGGFSWTGGGPEYPPMPPDKKIHWRDKRTCVLPVKLEPARFYRVGINSTSFENFQSAAGFPVEPTMIYFTTQGAGPEDLDKVKTPEIVAMDPPNESGDVDPAVKELRVTFNVPMGGGFSWVHSGPRFPPAPAGKKAYWTDDHKTCVLPVELKPGQYYRLSLNSNNHKNFQSAAGVPLYPPVIYSFWTKKADDHQ